MRLLGTDRLSKFAKRHPQARKSLEAWKALAEKVEARHFAELKATFGSADYAAPQTIFDVGGNKFRIIAVVGYLTRTIWIEQVFTHDEYEAWSARRAR